MNLSQTVVFLTGASSGIGRATAVALAHSGAHIALAARRLDKLQALVTEIHTTTPGKALAIQVDVANEQDVRNAMQSTRDALGPIHVLINNAGFGYFSSAVDMDMDVMDRMMNVNFRGAVLCTKHALPDMLAREQGTIINILSIAAKTGIANGSGYAASKFALRGYAESLFMEVRNNNIRVVNICPSSVATEFFDVASYNHPHISKALQPNDIAATVLTALQLPQNATVMELEIRPTNPK